MDALHYINKAQKLAEDYPTNGAAIFFLKTLEEDGDKSESTLNAAKSLIKIKGE